MSDGHLNKCKACARKEAHERRQRLANDQTFVEMERERGREKYKLLNYRKRTTLSQEVKRAAYPSLRRAKRMLGIEVPRTIELHHWNYNLIKSVILLPRRIHHLLHAKMELNVMEGIYYHDGAALNTIDKHLELLRQVCNENGYDFSKIDLGHI